MIALPRVESSPNDRAQALAGRSYLSWSALSTFRQCPLRYWLKYVLGLKEQTVSANLVFGAALHAAFQRHYETLMAEEPPPDLEDLLGAYRTHWAERREAEVIFGADNIDDLEALAEKLLKLFLRHPLSRPEGRLLGAEEPLMGTVLPDCPDLLMRLDLIVETEEAVIVTDFKTSRSRWSASQAEEQAMQLLLYRELAQELVPGKPVRLQFAVFTKTKTPSLDLVPVPVNPAGTRRILALVRRLWAALEAGHYYPNPSPLQCPTCPYQRECRDWPGADS